MQNLLEMRPVRLREYRMTDSQKGDGRITVLIPKFGKGKIGRWFSRFSKHPDYFVRLDDFGSFVWQMCNGENRVKGIGDALKNQFGDKTEPVYDRLSLFLKQMEKAKLITFKETSKVSLTPTQMKS